MKFFILLWILCKSTFTSFAGLASLPEIRHELVDERHWATDAEVDQSIVITRTTPGPVGVWVVSVGYMVDGWPGAIAGWIAMALPSMVVILLVGYFGRRAQHPRVRSMLQCVVLASASLLVLAAIPIGRDALDGWLTIGITVVALPLLLAKRVNTLWIITGAAVLSFTGSMIGVAGLSGAPTATCARVLQIKRVDPACPAADPGPAPGHGARGGHAPAGVRGGVP